MCLENRVRIPAANQESMTSLISELMERIFAGLMCVILFPFWLINVVLAVICFEKPLIVDSGRDLMGRKVARYHFSRGMVRSSPAMLQVFIGVRRLVGLPVECPVSNLRRAFGSVKPGVTSLYALQKLSGYCVGNADEATLKQQQMGVGAQWAMAARYWVTALICKPRILIKTARFSLFGIRINNLTMAQAVNKVLPMTPTARPQLSFFVNVNSYNLAQSLPSLKDTINSADWVFADGSGVRLAAQKSGLALLDNVNGTDMLPELCERAAMQDKSLFLLGAAPGVAEQAGVNLSDRFPGLEIAGSHHGFFDEEENQNIITQINESGASILLVAMGTPLQEAWCVQHRDALQVETVLAVGGLFDFYSGRIPRAPLWMRELGLEWVWRLRQEPIKKFRRYVIGNPLFLYRTLIASRG